jgi:hypothetical protein
MNIQQRVQDILNKFDVNLTVTEEKSTELAEVTLENGTVVYTDDEFAVGAEAYIINDEGERISVPAGDYELADGRLMVVGENGAIEDIKAAEEPAEEPVAEEAEADRVEQSADEPEATEEATEEELEVEVEIEMEDEDEDKPSYVTRAEVEEMIRSAFEALKEEDKEDMSDVNPEAPKEEPKTEEAPEADPVAEELAAVKAELSEMKDEAVPMLKHATPTATPEHLDLSKLSLTERVAALHSKFSQK